MFCMYCIWTVLVSCYHVFFTLTSSNCNVGVFQILILQRKLSICHCSSLQVIPGALQVHNDNYDLHYDGQLLLFLPTCKLMYAMFSVLKQQNERERELSIHQTVLTFYVFSNSSNRKTCRSQNYILLPFYFQLEKNSLIGQLDKSHVTASWTKLFSLKSHKLPFFYIE